MAYGLFAAGLFGRFPEPAHIYTHQPRYERREDGDGEDKKRRVKLKYDRL